MVKFNTPAIFLLGPTASGKSDLALNIADSYPVEIVSVDSAMVYKDMDIGSCKPSKEEREKFKHHLVDILLPNEDFDLGVFLKFLDSAMEEIQSKQKIPLFVGGSMMFQSILIDGFHNFPSSENLKDKLEAEYKEYGLEHMQKKLKMKDHETYNTVDIQNPRRILRSLEIIHLTKQKLSRLKKQEKVKPFQSDQIFVIEINDHKNFLHEKAEKRIDFILNQGFVRELEDVYYKYNLNMHSHSMQAINYKQYLPYINGKKTLKECTEDAFRATKVLVKSQQTWLKKLNKDTQLQCSDRNIRKKISATIDTYLRSIKI